jgi:Zn-dependent protease with chaperone function
MSRRAITALGLLGLLHFAPVVAATAPPPPPCTGAYQPQGTDEVGIWREDDESERELAASPLLIRDEKLTGYVKQVLCDTVGEDRCKPVRVYIIREPSFNASMSPNGTLRVLSGLFLRVHNEAELASVLGHEFGHFERRHGLAKFKANRKGTDIIAWATVLASMAPTYRSRQAYTDLRYSVYGNLLRYERDQEREADLVGIGYLNASKLRPQAASQVWANIMGEIEASARVRGLKKPQFNQIAFTASHPPNAERAAYLAELASPDANSRSDGKDGFQKALASWLPLFLSDQIKLNDFGASEYLINKLAENGWSADLWFERAELYRGRGNQRDLVNAAGFYENAISLNPNLADAYRGLGLSLIRTGQVQMAQQPLIKYLELNPSALDSSMIMSLITHKEASQ